jgi:hypothetical protein
VLTDSLWRRAAGMELIWEKEQTSGQCLTIVENHRPECEEEVGLECSEQENIESRTGAWEGVRLLRQ